MYVTDKQFVFRISRTGFHALDHALVYIEYPTQAHENSITELRVLVAVIVSANG